MIFSFKINSLGARDYLNYDINFLKDFIIYHIQIAIENYGLSYKINFKNNIKKDQWLADYLYHWLFIKNDMSKYLNKNIKIEICKTDEIEIIIKQGEIHGSK